EAAMGVCCRLVVRFSAVITTSWSATVGGPETADDATPAGDPAAAVAADCSCAPAAAAEAAGIAAASAADAPPSTNAAQTNHVIFIGNPQHFFGPHPMTRRRERLS